MTLLLPYVVFICIGHCLKQVVWQYGCLCFCFKLHLFFCVLKASGSKTFKLFFKLAKRGR